MNDRYRLGIDIGGTFTDFALFDADTGAIFRHKQLTSPVDPSESALAGARRICEVAGVDLGQVGFVAHGTTLVANAILERKGARTALVTTAGFRDVLEIGHENRYDIYDLNLKRAQPLVPRRLRFEIKERLDLNGIPIVELGADEIRRCVADLASSDVGAVAICLLHSFRNSNHEVLLASEIRDQLPTVAVSLSSDVSPEIREYERMSTTCANAYVQPLVSRYVETLEREFVDRRGERRLFLMLSEGGLTSSDVVRQFPIRLIESGPAAGVLYAGLVGKAAGVNDLVAFDMGGTTAKACLVRNGRPRKTTTLEVARTRRLKKGSGLPIRVPSVELIEIGTGGGSIAKVDRMGLIRVGPESAGADPGPACYGREGKAPTVTDANLVLGYLNADYFLGGRLRLDSVAAERAIDDAICKVIDLSLLDAADGIYRIASEEMASAIRVHLAEVGADPRNCTLVAFGGAGPLHASYVARVLQMQGFICPPRPGVASAIGLLGAPISFDVSRSVLAKLGTVDLVTIASVLDELESQARAHLISSGVANNSITIESSLDMRYHGQFYEVTVPVPRELPLERDTLRDAFVREYEMLYRHRHDEMEVQLVTCRLRAAGATPSTGQLTSAEAPTPPISGSRTRPAYSREWGGKIDVSVYERSELPMGTVVEGPALIEEPESTTLIEPAYRGRIDELGNIRVDRRAQ